MTKPLLANSAKAKADFKAMMRPGTSFKLNIWGWQIANPNYAKAEIRMALAVPSEGVLNYGEPTCSAGSRSFGTTATTRSLFCAHKYELVFHPPLRRAVHKFARSGLAKQGVLSQHPPPPLLLLGVSQKQANPPKPR
jgi:hypothetical protein